MSDRVSKHQDFRAAIAKAGGPNAADIPTKRTPRGRKPQKQVSDPKATSTQAVSKVSKLETELREARAKRSQLEARIKTLEGQAKSEKVRSDRAQRNLAHLEDVIAKVRRSLGAGKDAKADDMPVRITALQSRATLLEAESRAAIGREMELREQIESLNREIETRAEELERRKQEDELTIIDSRGEVDQLAGLQSVPSEGDFSLVSDEGKSGGDEIVPTFFSRVLVSDSIEHVMDRYASWVLGFQDYKRARMNRVRDGIDEDWGIRDLVGPDAVNLEGKNGTRVTARKIDGTWFLRFIHKDSRYEGTEWWNLARLSLDTEGTKVEHAMIRFTGARANRPTSLAVPRVLKDLLRSSKLQEVWEDFKGGPKEVTATKVDLFVRDVLLAPTREVPVVVATRMRNSGGFLVDPHKLADALDGMAVVFSTAQGTDFILTDALRDAGLDPRLMGCFDGGVRVYMPGFGEATDPYHHILWVRSFLEKRSQEERVRLIARKVASYSVGLRVPPGFARVIEDHDLRLQAENSTRLQISGQTNEQVKALVDQVIGLQEALERVRTEAEQVPPLRQELRGVRERAEYHEGINQMLEVEYQKVKEERDQHLKRIHNLNAKLLHAEELSRDAQNAKIFLGSDLIDGLLADSWSEIGAYARLLQARFFERVIFLPETLTSADECTFQPVEKAKELLFKLVTAYYEILVGGGNDGQASKVFGKNVYAPKESDNLSTDGIRARTRCYEGEEYYFESHIKITKAEETNSSNRVFRTYFEWDGRRSKLIIGHIGKHLPL